MDEFDAIISQAKRIVGVHRSIASDVFPHGVVLRCGRCGYSARHGRDDAARFLSTGWPKHCGATMSADTPEKP